MGLPLAVGQRQVLGNGYTLLNGIGHRVMSSSLICPLAKRLYQLHILLKA
jgi:hypothetical protein